MKASIGVICFCLSSIFSVLHAAEISQKRVAEQQPSYEELQSPHNDRSVVVKFNRGQLLAINNEQQMSGLDKTSLHELENTLGSHGAVLKPMFSASTDDIRSLTAKAQENTERELTDLTLYFLALVEDSKHSSELAYELGQLDFIEYAVPVRSSVLPNNRLYQTSVDISPRTQDLSNLQVYKNDAPLGIELPKQGSLQGTDGSELSIVDVEQGWILDHEDLVMSEQKILAPSDFVSFVPNAMLGGTGIDHGTAVLGILAASPNQHGMTGIVPRADIWVSPEIYLNAASSVTRDNLIVNRFDAIMRAIRHLDHGDILVLELQTRSCGSENYGPAEWDRPVFDLVEIATAEGIVVVAAAGNGGLNLDSSDCKSRFDRQQVDSGAIIVGASYSNNARHKLPTSSFGERVDVHAWGENIATLGYNYGGISPVSYDERQSYTDDFGGTSGATAIVAAAAASIQSRVKYCQREALTSQEMRALLVKTGTAQQAAPPLYLNQHIGPQPNVLSALLEERVVGYCLNLPNTTPATMSVSQSTGSFGSSRTVTVKNMNGERVYFRAEIGNSDVSPYMTVTPSRDYIPAYGSIDLTVSIRGSASYNIPRGSHTAYLDIYEQGGTRPYTYRLPVRVRN